MTLQKLFIAAVGVLALQLTSCKTEDPEKDGFGNVSSTHEMKVPTGFDYSTTKTINFDITTESVWGKEKLRVDLYDFMPQAGGEVISSLFMNGYGHVEGNIIVPVDVDEIYAVLSHPDGSSTTAKVEITGTTATHIFSPKKNSKKKVTASPDCNTGCGTTVHNSNSWYNAAGGGVYCFTGNISQGINVKNGSTLRICGTGTFQLSVETNAQVEIVDGANVTITNFNINASADKITIYPNAVVSVTNWATPGGDVINYGDLTFANLGINSTCEFTNYGNVQITGSGWYTVGGILTNYGHISYQGNLNQNSSGLITNNCSMSVAKQLKLDAIFQNNGYVDVAGKLFISSNGNMKLNNGAMAVAEDIHIDGTIEGTGSTSLMKLNDQISGNSGARIKGNLEFCSAGSIQGFSGSFVAPATQACNVYIPITSCNAEGNGSLQILDDDTDGVSNKLDMFPNDPTASGAAFYPSDSSFATLLFEDLWPGVGDYDFNDLVLGYSHMLVTNPNNEVVRVESKFVVKAIGGSLKNGFGFQFDVAPSVVSSVTGQLLGKNIVTLAANGTEQGQAKATIIVFEDAYETVKNRGGLFVNTVPSEPYKLTDTITIHTTFTAPQTIASLGEGPFNPFIFINGERGRELHLIDHTPTDLVNPALLGSSSDDSDPASARYYQTSKGHPWALNIKGDLRYMQEKIDIVKGYNLFATWAQSGGTQAKDWYMDHANYRDGSKLY